jgi:hypothetical protein
LNNLKTIQMVNLDTKVIMGISLGCLLAFIIGYIVGVNFPWNVVKSEAFSSTHSTDGYGCGCGKDGYGCGCGKDGYGCGCGKDGYGCGCDGYGCGCDGYGCGCETEKESY